LTGEYLGVLRAIQPNQLTESDFTTDLDPIGTPDLTIAKQDNADPIRVGDPLTYTLTVSNNGTAAASNVRVTDTLPTGFVPGATTVSNGFTASASGQTVTFTGGSIAAGGTATLTIAASTATATVGTKSNTARVDPLNAIVESNETNNSITETTRVDAAPTLAPEINVTDGGFGGTTDNILDGDTTPSTADGTDYGSTVVGTALTRTFTIENTGTAALTLSAPTLPNGFSLVGAFPTSIAVGGNATFTVQLNATTVGTFSGNISFGNNDSNENPYNFAIRGVVDAAPAPEINVTDGGFGGATNNIVDGDATPSATDGTDYGSTVVGTEVTRTFTIENTGSALLTLSAPTLPTGFSLVGAFPTSIAAGSNATFTVQLDAAATGTFTGQISFGNNDSNENPYNFTVRGVVGSAPGSEINVTDGGFGGGAPNNIADGDATPSTTDGTDYGTTTVGTAVTRTFTIQNAGTAELTLSAPTLPTGFSLAGAFPTSIAAGSNATFTVQLDATATGTFSGDISFGNNDSNENPYNFAIAGSVVTPEINITVDDINGRITSILDGDTTPSADDRTDYGTTAVGTPLSQTFRIENTGTAALTLNAPTLPTGFSLVGTFPTSIAAGSNATFTVQLNATTAGTFSGEISFGNNDSDENPYNFVITGIVNAPEINVTDGGFNGATDSIADGNTTPNTADGTDYGTTTVGTTVSRTFTIQNTGAADLNLTTGSITVPTGFTITGTPAATLAPGASTTITVELTAASVGTFSGDISIPNNDSDENPYNFAITGTVNAPEINVTDGGFNGATDNIIDGDTTPSNADGTDYGSTPLGTAITRTFTIENTGAATLNLTTGSITVPTGYTITTLPSATVAPGASTTIEVQLTAATAGTFAGDITIPNDDSDENPYNFAITGTVTEPEINVTDGGFGGGAPDSIADGDTTPSNTDGTDYGSTPVGTALTRTFTIENNGTAPLTLTAPTLPTGFSLVGAFPTSIAVGSNATFTVQLDATTAGTFGGDISFANNDSDENLYNFAITGTVTAPEINVTDGGFGGTTDGIADGDTTPSTNDGTDYGRTNAGTPVTRTFTIANEGTADLNLTTGSITVPTGYTITTTPAATVAPGGSTTIAVQLTAATSGTFAGDISIPNNDSNENPYNFAITGTVNAPPGLGAATAGAITINEQTPTIISPTGLGITDDETNTESATIQITGNFQSGEDVLSVVGALPSGITAVAFNPATGTLTLTGSATVASYTTALRQIAYTNTSDNPNTATRTVSFTVNDGDADSNTVTRDITVQPVNDPPTRTPAPTYTGNANLTLTVPDGASDLLTGATDPDGTAVSVLAATLTSTVAAVTATTADDNNVTVNADGSFTYRPVAGFVGNDTFIYQIEDSGTPLPAVTTNVVATITVNDLDGAGAGNSVLWFIDEDAIDSANLGTQGDPFRSLAAFNTANTGTGNNPANTDFIFIDDDAGGDDNGDGAGTYGGGITLRANQKLIGDGSSSTLAAITGITLGSFNDLDAFSSNRPNISGGITLNTGNTLRGLNAGNNAGGFSITGGAVGNLTISEASVNNTSGGGFNVGTSGALNVVLDSLSSNGGTNGVNLTNTTGTFTANGGTITSPTGAAFNISGGSVNTTYAGSITQANNEAAVSLAGGHTGTATFQTGTINATNGTGLQFNNADGTYNFNGTTTLNGGDAGIDIIGGSGGTFAFSANTSINNPSGIAYNEDTSTANVTYNGTITKTNNANNAVNINAKTGGTTTFNGQITGTTTTANAIDLTNNTGGTVNFTGALALNTTSGIGFNATGAGPAATTGGTVSATGTNNTIASTTGTALNVVNTTISASGLTFRSISSNGGTNGIVLNNTGASGGLTVTGTGTAGSGGTIQSKTGDGISLQNTRNVSLSFMNVQNNLGSGIFGDNLTNFTLSNSLIDNNSDTLSGGGVEAGLRFGNLLGTSAITNSTISNSDVDNIRLTPSSGTLNLTISGSTISASSGGNGFAIDSSGTAATTVTMTGNTFSNNFASGFLTTIGGTSLNVVATGNTFQDNNIGFDLGNGVSSDVTANVSNNTFLRHAGSAINVVSDALSTSAAEYRVTIANNQIGNGTADSGSRNAFGIAVDTRGDVDAIMAITGNNIRNTDIEGIFVQSRLNNTAGQGKLDLTLTGNTVATPDDNSAFPFLTVYTTRVEARNSTTMTANISGNTFASGVGGFEGIRVRERDTAVFRIERLSDGDATPNEIVTSTALVETRLLADNPATTTADAALIGTFVGFTEAAAGATRTP
jgi:hypothetical protein